MRASANLSCGPQASEVRLHAKPTHWRLRCRLGSGITLPRRRCQCCLPCLPERILGMCLRLDPTAKICGTPNVTSKMCCSIATALFLEAAMLEKELILLDHRILRCLFESAPWFHCVGVISESPSQSMVASASACSSRILLHRNVLRQ